MTFLLLEISFYLLAMFILGVLFGWAVWGRRASAAPRSATPDAMATGSDTSEIDALRDALVRLNHEKSALAKQLGLDKAS